MGTLNGYTKWVHLMGRYGYQNDSHCLLSSFPILSLYCSPFLMIIHDFKVFKNFTKISRLGIFLTNGPEFSNSPWENIQVASRCFYLHIDTRNLNLETRLWFVKTLGKVHLTQKLHVAQYFFKQSFIALTALQLLQYRCSNIIWPS